MDSFFMLIKELRRGWRRNHGGAAIEFLFDGSPQTAAAMRPHKLSELGFGGGNKRRLRGRVVAYHAPYDLKATDRCGRQRAASSLRVRGATWQQGVARSSFYQRQNCRRRV